MQKNTSPGQKSQPDREIIVNTTRSKGSPEPPECFPFGVGATREGAATTHLLYSVSPQFSNPLQQSHMALSVHPGASK